MADQGLPASIVAGAGAKWLEPVTICPIWTALKELSWQDSPLESQ